MFLTLLTTIFLTLLSQTAWADEAQDPYQRLMDEPLNLRCKVKQSITLNSLHFFNPKYEDAEVFMPKACIEKQGSCRYATFAPYMTNAIASKESDAVTFDLFAFRDYVKISGSGIGETMEFEGTDSTEPPYQVVKKMPVGVYAKDRAKSFEINVNQGFFHTINTNGAEDIINVGECKKIIP